MQANCLKCCLQCRHSINYIYIYILGNWETKNNIFIENIKVYIYAIYRNFLIAKSVTRHQCSEFNRMSALQATLQAICLHFAVFPKSDSQSKIVSENTPIIPIIYFGINKDMIFFFLRCWFPGGISDGE